MSGEALAAPVDPWPACPTWCEVRHGLLDGPTARRREHLGSVPWALPPLVPVPGMNGSRCNRSSFLTVVRVDEFVDGVRVVGRPEVRLFPAVGARLDVAGLTDDRVGALRLEVPGVHALLWLLTHIESWDEVASLTAALREVIVLTSTITPTERPLSD